MGTVLSRREFLERAALSAAAVAIANQGLAARAGMFITMMGVDAPHAGPWPATARLAARLGYGGIHWDFGSAKEAGEATTRALFTDLKIIPNIVNLPMARPFPFGGEEAAFREALPKLADDAAFAASVGCARMMAVLSPGSSRPKDEQRKFVRDRLAAIDDVLQASKVRLGLEFLGPLYFRSRSPHPFIWTLPETVALAADSGPNIGAVLDAWHWYHSGGTVAEIRATDVSRIVHVHISDAKKMAPELVRDNMRLMPGEGVIDLIGFLQAVQQVGYEGGVAPEPIGRFPPNMSAEDAARLALDTTRAVMKKAGVA